MKLVIARQPVRTMLRWTQRLLFFAAAMTLGYWALAEAGAWLFQRSEHHLSRQWPDAPLPAEKGMTRAVAPVAPDVPVATTPLLPRHAIGRLEIPRLDLSVAFVEGVSEFALWRAAGHIPGTALPGRPGNVGISAHRDTYFRPLKDIRLRDVIVIATPQGRYYYRVVSIRVVSASDVSVLEPGDGETLTLVTCHPFFDVGPAPDRFVVRAERMAIS